MADNEHRALDFVRESSLGLPGAIKDVADYLLSEGTGVASLTMAQVAARTYTSKPTLVRFAKLAGYAGWPAFRRDFILAAASSEAEQAQRVDVNVNVPYAKGAPAHEVADAIIRTHHLACDEARKSVRPEVLEAAAHSIIQAGNVAFLGVAQNRNYGLTFSSRLGIMGILCHVPLMDDSAHLVRLFGEGDCVVAASYSGDLIHQPFNFVPRLLERGVQVIAVTSSQRSPLGDIATHMLGFPPLEHLHGKIAPFYSGACTSIILDMLYAACYARQYEKSVANHSDLLAELDGLIPEDRFRDGTG